MDDTRRCHAKKKNGERCKKAAILGGRVCGTHGGSAPQVRNAARRRLMEAADPAAARLVELLDSDDERIRLGAAKDLLDRAGHKPPTEVSFVPTETLMDMLEEERSIDGDA